jgi:hypothetical protein
MSDNSTYEGQCFCGAVQLTVTGKPQAMGYCHCESCRHWSAGPVNAFTLWSPESVQIHKGYEHLSSYQKTVQSIRKWCALCGGHILTEHPEMGLTDVYAAIIPQLDFQPSVHVHYQETVLRMDDALPKMRDVPAEMGGSGELMPS